MLNHTRTLLLNQSTTAVPGNYVPGDELVAEGYTSVSLSSSLLSVRRALFGSDPDRYMLNYRLRQFMAILHATPLVEFVLAQDSRVTYPEPDQTLLARTLYQPQVLGRDGTLTVLGTPAAPDTGGRMKHVLRVTRLDADTVQIRRQTPPMTVTRIEMTETDGVSSVMDLVDLGYRFRLHQSVPGDSWTVDVVLRPQWDLARILTNLASLGETVFLELFGVPAEEPYLSWRNLWYHGRDPLLRLGAVLLALAYRTEERRTG